MVWILAGDRFPIVDFPWVRGFTMAHPTERSVCVKFCFKLVKTAAETHQMFKQAFGDKSLGQAQTYD
jgi:hypothetical protein